MDYAVNEDNIRKLYEELEQETQRLHVLTPFATTSSTDLRLCLLECRHTRKKS